MRKVTVRRDDSGHWYIIPSEMDDEFYRLLEEEQYEELDSKFSKYMTGGDINNIQLYAEV